MRAAIEDEDIRLVGTPLTGTVIDAAITVHRELGAGLLELKSVEELRPVHRAQLLTYLKLAGLRIGLLINFNCPALRDGIKRLVR